MIFRYLVFCGLFCTLIFSFLIKLSCTFGYFLELFVTFVTLCYFLWFVFFFFNFLVLFCIILCFCATYFYTHLVLFTYLICVSISVVLYLKLWHHCATNVFILFQEYIFFYIVSLIWFALMDYYFKLSILVFKASLSYLQQLKKSV